MAMAHPLAAAAAVGLPPGLPPGFAPTPGPPPHGFPLLRPFDPASFHTMLADPATHLTAALGNAQSAAFLGGPQGPPVSMPAIPSPFATTVVSTATQPPPCQSPLTTKVKNQININGSKRSPSKYAPY